MRRQSMNIGMQKWAAMLQLAVFHEMRVRMTILSFFETATSMFSDFSGSLDLESWD